MTVALAVVVGVDAVGTAGTTELEAVVSAATLEVGRVVARAGGAVDVDGTGVAGTGADTGLAGTRAVTLRVDGRGRVEVLTTVGVGVVVELASMTLLTAEVVVGGGGGGGGLRIAAIVLALMISSVGTTSGSSGSSSSP